MSISALSSAARGTFGERDLAVQAAFAGLAAALFMAHNGPDWLASINSEGLPVRRTGN
jgi:hypothetical protein